MLAVVASGLKIVSVHRGSETAIQHSRRLSRLDDEYGTRTMYERLGDSDVETHLYSVQDDPDVISELDIHVHSGDTAAYRRSWVVVFTPDESSRLIDTDPTSAALVAVETGPNVWRGVWSYDSTRVKRIQSYVKQEL